MIYGSGCISRVWLCRASVLGESHLPLCTRIVYRSHFLRCGASIWVRWLIAYCSRSAVNAVSISYFTLHGLCRIGDVSSLTIYHDGDLFHPIEGARGLGLFLSVSSL